MSISFYPYLLIGLATFNVGLAAWNLHNSEVNFGNAKTNYENALDLQWQGTAMSLPEGSSICPRGYEPADPYANLSEDPHCFTKHDGQLVKNVQQLEEPDKA